MPENDSLHRDVLSCFLKQQIRTYLEYTNAGEMTLELEKAYEVFLNTAIETFYEDPNGFCLDKVFVKIPRNEWLQICLQKNN